MTNKEWLAQLQVGDTVIVRQSGIGSSDKVDKVAKITPSGRVHLENSSTQYNSNGTARGVKDTYFNTYLMMPTDKLLYNIKKEQTYKKVHRLVMTTIEWQELSLEQLEEALEFLQQYEEELA